MLVLDQLKLHIYKDPAPTTAMDWLARHFQTIESFDISNIISIVEDWTEEKNAPVPKTPPFDPVWVEYRDPNGPPGHRVGFFIRSVPLASLLPLYDVDASKEVFKKYGRDFGPHEEKLQRILDLHDPLSFECKSFFYCENRLTEDAFTSHAFIEKNTERVEFVELVYNPESPEVADILHGGLEDRYCNLPRVYSKDKTQQFVRTVEFPTYCFFAFALLHCRNIEMVHHNGTGPGARARKRRGEPPYSSYRVLRLNVPAASQLHSPDPVPGSEHSVRFHICRGHFKNLLHLRYKNKGWHWWPAHWRGNVGEGFVIKDYQLETAPPESEDPHHRPTLQP